MTLQVKSNHSICCVTDQWHKVSGSYLMEQQVQGAIAHKLCDYAEELGLVADAKDLDDVVEPGFVKHLGLLQQAIPLSEMQQVTNSSKHQQSDNIYG